MQTFVVDLRGDSLGGESLASAMLYPLMANRRIVRMEYSQAYAHREDLHQLTVDLHVQLQRSLTESKEWILAALMDQTTDADPDWGSLSHQIRALRHHVLSPLEEEFGQQPVLTLGILLDHWDREAQTQIPTSDHEFIQWSIDHFGMLRVDPSSGPSPVSEETLSQYPHLLTKADLAPLTDRVSETKIDELFDEKIQACRSVRHDVEELGDVRPPAREADHLISIRESLKESLDQSGTVESSPSEVLQNLAKRHLSALGPAIYHQRNDLVLLRIPVRRTPLPRRKRDLIYRDYVLGILPLLFGPDLKEALASVNDEILAYWVGETKTADQASRIDLSEDELCAAAREYRSRLQQVEASLDLEHLSDYKIELLKPFDHSCDLEYSDEWKSTVERLNEFSFVRSAPTNRWSRWVDSVNTTIEQKHERLSSDLTECLIDARQRWSDHPTKVREGTDIDALVTELRRTYEAKREGIFAESPEGFTNDWTERAEAHADAVRRAFQLRPTNQHLWWALGLTFLLLLLTVLFSLTSPSQRLLSFGFWSGACVLVLGLGFYVARRRLISFVEQQTKQACDEAESVIHNLHRFVQNRESTIERYFEALAAEQNVENAQQLQREIESDRLHHHHHQQALREHAENAEALLGFLGCPSPSAPSSTEASSSDLDNVDTPPFESSLYALRRFQSRRVKAFGAEVDTRLLPGLEEIDVDPDPAFQV